MSLISRYYEIQFGIDDITSLITILLVKSVVKCKHFNSTTSSYCLHYVLWYNLYHYQKISQLKFIIVI